METFKVSTSTASLSKKPPDKLKRTEVVAFFRLHHLPPSREPILHSFVQYVNPAIKPHSLPGNEAKPQISKPPFAQMQNRKHPWFVYFARLINPVMSITNTSYFQIQQW